MFLMNCIRKTPKAMEAPKNDDSNKPIQQTKSAVKRIESSSTNATEEKDSWDLVRERYKIQAIIGRGATGYVTKAKDRVTNERVAIKHIKVDGKSQYTYKKILREIKIMRHLTLMPENVHTVKILDLIVNDDLTEIFIVMNYVHNDLQNLFSQ